MPPAGAQFAAELIEPTAGNRPVLLLFSLPAYRTADRSISWKGEGEEERADGDLPRGSEDEILSAVPQSIEHES